MAKECPKVDENGPKWPIKVLLIIIWYSYLMIKPFAPNISKDEPDWMKNCEMVAIKFFKQSKIC